jgi:hypothetical protein
MTCRRSASPLVGRHLGDLGEERLRVVGLLLAAAPGRPELLRTFLHGGQLGLREPGRRGPRLHLVVRRHVRLLCVSGLIADRWCHA